MNFRLTLLVAASLTVITTTARAEDAATPPRPTDTHSVISLTSENDLYATHNQDRHYTNGIRLGWMSGQDTDWARGIGDWLPLPASADHYRIGFALGHNLYTPQNKSTSAPILDDRPYGAWLYAAFKLEAESANQLDNAELDLGVVGPWAKGRQVQNDWHSLIGASAAQGWSNQIKNEPGVNFEYDRLWRIPLSSPEDGVQFDIIPNATASVGNIFTYAGAGGIVRFGQELQADFGPPRIQPGLPGSDSFHPLDSFGWYFFAGVEGRAVARNIFLDGNTFTDSQHVSKKPFVGDLQAGVTLIYQQVRLSYTNVLRSAEFDGQRGADYLGSITLSTAF
jgi:lipid A 3-O-deacylase